MNEKVITMILKNGTADGIVECELGNWIGKCYKIPRTRLAEANKLPGINNSGVYILFGIDDMTGNNIAYIGKSKSIYSRIDEHKRKKEFWKDAVVFVTNDNSINPSHIDYIEYELCETANKLKNDSKYLIKNDQSPKNPNLRTADEIIAKEFLLNVKIIVSSLKYPIFDEITSKDIIVDNETFYLTYGGERVASAKVTDKGFMILKGSKIPNEISKNISPSIVKYVENERNSTDISNNIFVNNHISSSPSMAATIILGINTNGRTAWKNDKGITLKEIQEKDK